MSTTEPRPRHYARQILSIRDLEQRRRALLEVPAEWQELVRTHVAIAWSHPSKRKAP